MGSRERALVRGQRHAESAGLADPGGPDASALVLSDAKLTLGDLALDAPTSTPLAGKPLVFINACESAELSPAFYDGFVPYFMAKGARGVVGTECKIPALFGAEWARRFFGRFLGGETLGEAFFALRREFLKKNGNPLGLLYAVHCDGDTQIHPVLPLVGSPRQHDLRAGERGPAHVIALLTEETQAALGQIGAQSPAEARNVVVRHPGALPDPHSS